MKKVLLILIILLTGASVISAQRSKSRSKSRKAKVSAAKTSEVKAETREKFDPKRVAADDLNGAVTKATAENKRIILDIGGEWCGWCRLMDNFLIKNAELGKLRDDNFVWVKINFSEENENAAFLAAYPKIIGYPHLFVLEKDGKFLYSQDTSELEEAKGYNLQKFTDFFVKWSPVKADK